MLKKIGLDKIDDSKGEVENFVFFPNFDLTNPGKALGGLGLVQSQQG